MNRQRIVHLNGEYLPETEARISVFDRGFLFADAVYEVTSVLDGRLVDYDAHHARLSRSLAELAMPAPPPRDALLAIHRELVARNGLREGMVYLQISRGDPGDRDFHFPPPEVPPTLVLFTQQAALVDNPRAAAGIRVVTLPDLRWARRDIKTVQLLRASLAKMEAKRAGADDAWLVEAGRITEGSSSNAWIVSGGRIVTRALSRDILHGITRAAVLRCAAEAGMTVVERGFTPAEAQAADEAFITSASAFVTPVVAIDGKRLGDGAPGPLTRRLREIYVAEARRGAI